VPLVSGCFLSTCTNNLRGSHGRTVWKWNRSLPLRVRLSRASVFLTRCRVAISSARSVRSFFSKRDRASTRPFVDARGPSITSALGRDPPDTDKIFRSSCGFLAAPIRNTPGRAARSRGHIELARSRRDSLAERRRINTVTKSHYFLQDARVHATLFQPGRRTGQRWEPTRAPRQGSKGNEGGPSGSPLFIFAFLFELFALNPSGVRGTPPENRPSVLQAASVEPSNSTNSWCFLIRNS
jgi:hypothetical protein